MTNRDHISNCSAYCSRHCDFLTNQSLVFTGMFVVCSFHFSNYCCRVWIQMGSWIIYGDCLSSQTGQMVLARLPGDLIISLFFRQKALFMARLLNHFVSCQRGYAGYYNSCIPGHVFSQQYSSWLVH